jgi:L-galactose dehydrogenase
MQRLKESGKVRFIGVTGLQLELLEDLARKSDLDVVLSYARYNLMIQDLERSLRPYCEGRGIGLINASPLLLGALTQNGPPAWHPASKEALAACAKAAVACAAEGIDIAQLALRFCLDHSYAATTLVGMSTRAQLESNMGALDLKAPAALLRKVRSILAPFAAAAWASGLPENQDSTVAH